MIFEGVECANKTGDGERDDERRSLFTCTDAGPHHKRMNNNTERSVISIARNEAHERLWHNLSSLVYSKRQKGGTWVMQRMHVWTAWRFLRKQTRQQGWSFHIPERSQAPMMEGWERLVFLPWVSFPRMPFILRAWNDDEYTYI